MSMFGDMKLRTKMMLVFLLVGLVPASIIGLLSLNKSSYALDQQTIKQLESVRGIKKAEIESFFQARQDDMAVLVETADAMLSASIAKLEAVQALKADNLQEIFDNTFAALFTAKNDPFLNQAYYQINIAFESGDRQVNTEAWNTMVEKYDDRLQSIRKSNVWDDILLVNDKGYIVYTTAREADLGMKVSSDALKESSLTRAIMQLRSGNEELAVGDFQPYAPADGRQAAFIVARNGNAGGYLAIKLPKATINAVAQQRIGMSASMESYLVGELDGETYYRSDRVVKKDNKLGMKKSGSGVTAALAGKSGVEIKTSSTGVVEVEAYAPLDILGLRWVIITSGSLEELLASKAEGVDKDFFSKHIESYGYYDLFLIHPEGRIFYSVAREADYNTNIVDGKYRDSSLGKLVNKVLKSKTYDVSDFEPYAASNNEPAAFIAQPLLRDGKVELVVALQLSLEKINAVMNRREGLGETGETVLVGTDKLMRSDSVLRPETHSVKASFADPAQGRIDSAAVRNALAGQTGTERVIDNHGDVVLSAYAPLQVGDASWAILVEIDEAEALAAVKSLQWLMLVVALIAVTCVVITAWLVARGITRPLGGEPAEMQDVAQRIAEGDLNVNFRNGDSATGVYAALQAMVNKLREVVGDVQTASSNTASGSQQISSVSQQLSQGSTEQAASLEEISSSMEQMAANIRQSADNAGQTEQIAQKAATDADESGQAVSDGGRRDEKYRGEDLHHRRDRAPDQSAGAERGDRSGARRRARQGLRGGRVRSTQAGRTQPEGRGRDRRTLRQHRHHRRAGRQ